MVRGELRVFSICFILFAVSQSASGGELPLGDVSTEAPQPSLYDKIAEKAALSYYGIYRGPSVSDIGNSHQPLFNGQTDPNSPQSIENLLTTGYRFDKDLSAGVITHFYYFPIGNPTGAGQDIQMLDPILYLSRTNWVDRGNFKVKGLFYLAPGISKNDILKQQHLAMSFGPALSATYDVPNTGLTLGLYSYIRGYVPTSAANGDSRSYYLYAAPNLNYVLTKTLSATLWVDLIQAQRTLGTGFFSGLTNFESDIEPGINWDVNKYLSLNPVLNIYPGNLTLAATSLQAYIIAKAF